MKHILKLVAIGVISLAAVSSAQAFWQCRIHNGRGQTWIGTAPSRAQAAANATGFCVRNSRFSRNCVIDWCQPTVVAVPEPISREHRGGGWQCEVTNARGQLWVGNGFTHERAATRALQVCAANSTYSRNCVIRSCFTH